MRRAAVFSVIATMMLVAGLTARADEVRLADGSLVMGKVVSIAGGKLKVATEFAGEIEIELAKVSSIATAEPRQIRIGDAPAVEGTLGLDDGTQVLTVNGDVRPLALTEISDVRDVGAPPAPEKPRVNWIGKAEVGLTGKSGNTDRVDARALVSTTRVGPRGRLILTLRGAYAQVDGTRSQNEIMGTELYERDITDRLFGYQKLELEYDEFEDLDLRATLTAGLGYFVIRSKKQELKVRGGIAYQREQFNGGVTEDNFITEAGYDYRLDLNKWLRFTSRFTFFMEPADFDAWRFDAENAAEIPLSQKSGWKVKLGVRNEFDNMPQPGIEELDTTYYASLVYNWE